MGDIVVEEDEGFLSKAPVLVDDSRGQGEFGGCQGDDRTGNSPVEKAFVDHLATPEEGKPGEDRRDVAEVQGEARFFCPEPPACQVGLDPDLTGQQEGSKQQGQAAFPLVIDTSSCQHQGRDEGCGGGYGCEPEG